MLLAPNRGTVPRVEPQGRGTSFARLTSQLAGFVDGAARARRAHGWSYFVRRAARYGPGLLAWLYYRRRPPGRAFELGGQRYRYVYHLYNLTWQNERALEIPLASSEVERRRGQRVLEVGNVLSWYVPIAHDVVDRYERAPGVINQDILDYRPEQPYDLIVSVSTLEHIGWDESPRDPSKVLGAIDHLRALLARGGRLFFTLPLGYNHTLDGFLADGTLALSGKAFMLKVSVKPEWIEVDQERALAEARAEPSGATRAILIAHCQR